MVCSHHLSCLHIVWIPDAGILFLPIEEASSVKPGASQHLAVQGKNTGLPHGKDYKKENPSMSLQKRKIEI